MRSPVDDGGESTTRIPATIWTQGVDARPVPPRLTHAEGHGSACDQAAPVPADTIMALILLESSAISARPPFNRDAMHALSISPQHSCEPDQRREYTQYLAQ